MQTMRDRLKAARRRRGHTQEQLAALAGISRVQVARLESGSRGTRPRPEQIRALAAALHVDPEWLQFGSKLPIKTT